MKLEKEVNDAQFSGTVNTYYAGNYIYKKGNSHGQSDVALTFFNSEEGYVEPVFEQETTTTTFGTTIVERLVGFEYTYQYKDHLGNIRLSYQDMNGDGVISAETEIKEENHYYPFGLKHKGYNNQITGRDHQYTFTNKEEQNELSLNWSDYGARNYQADLGRWFNVDPAGEIYYDLSPFNFTTNNPISNIDPNGLWVVRINNSTDKRGNTTYSLSFIAEKGDDVKSLSKQLGLTVQEILKAHPELKGKKIKENEAFGLSNIGAVSFINNVMNEVSDKQDEWNCANFANGGCTSIKNQWYDPRNNNIEDFANNLAISYESVLEQSTRIGSIIHFKLEKGYEKEIEKEFINGVIQNWRNQGISEAEIKTRLADPRFKSAVAQQAKAIAVNERHFAIIVLKDKSGKKVQNILQKSGQFHFSHKKVDHIKNSRDLHPYLPTPIEGTKSPYYNYGGY